MSTRKSNETFKCELCSKEYKTENGYKNHKCKPKSSKPKLKKEIHCPDCGKVFKTETGYKNHKCIPKKTNEVHQCDLCNKSYKTEKGLIDHKCHIKLRMEEYKQAEGRIGFIAYKQFYKRVANNRSTVNKEKTLIDYVNSKYYKGFHSFGKFVVDINMPYYHEYIDFLITYSLPLTKWNDDQVYMTYIKTQNKKENSERAIEKTLNTMDKWSKKSNEPWMHYFDKEDKYRVVQAIRTGKISPWVIYNCQTGRNFMQTLDSTDLNQIFDIIDPSFWSLKFSRKSNEQHAIEDVLAQSGL